MTADRPPSLRDQIAQAMRDANGTPEALAAWQRHPQLVPVDVYADAVLHAIEAHIVLAHVDATQRADLLAGRLEQAERERDTAREALDAAAIVIASLRDQRDEQRQRADKAERRVEHFEEHAAQVDADLGIETHRAETAERKLQQALDQIATERRGRLAAEAAARRGREIHRRHDCTRHVNPRTPVPCVNAGLCEGCGAKHPCQTYTALTIKQPKETP